MTVSHITPKHWRKCQKNKVSIETSISNLQLSLSWITSLKCSGSTRTKLSHTHSPVSCCFCPMEGLRSSGRNFGCISWLSFFDALVHLLRVLVRSYYVLKIWLPLVHFDLQSMPVLVHEVFFFLFILIFFWACLVSRKREKQCRARNPCFPYLLLSSFLFWRKFKFVPLHKNSERNCYIRKMQWGLERSVLV